MSETTRRDAADQDRASRMGIGELLGFSAVIGLLAGCLFGVADILLHGRRPLPTDVLAAFALAAAPGALTLLALTIPAAVALWALRARPRRVDWIALLSAMSVIALTAATLVLAKIDLQNLRGFALVLGGVFVAIVAAALAYGIRPLHRKGVAIVWGAATILALIVAFPGALALTSRGVHSAAGVIAAGLGVLVAVTLVRFLRGRTPTASVGVIASAIGVFAAGFSQFADPGMLRPDRKTPESAQPPNVILIVLDTTRADHLGVYGGTGNLTPVLDEFAEGSVVYEDAFSTSQWTVPSHASMFTGLHPVSHGCSREGALRLDDKFETLAEMLKRQGYDTAAFYSNIWLRRANQLQGFDVKVYLDRHYIGLWLLPLAETLGLPSRWIDKGGSISGPELARWLANDRRPGTPFFLFINLLEAHTLYVPPRVQRDRFLPDGVSYLEASLFAKEFTPREWQAAGRKSPRAEKIVRAMYAAEVRYQDEVLGGILSLLRQSTDSDHNLIIVTADHGENLSDFGRWGHEFAVNDSLIHVPLIIQYPGSQPTTGRVPGLCQLTDLVPTVFDVIGQEAQLPPVGGHSLRPEGFRPADMITAQQAPDLTWLEAASRHGMSQPAFRSFSADKRVYRTARYKYVWSSDGRNELYAPSEDPLETTNLLEQEPEVALELNTKLLDWWNAQPAFRAEGPDSEVSYPMSEEVREQLRALGYIQ